MGGNYETSKLVIGQFIMTVTVRRSTRPIRVASNSTKLKGQGNSGKPRRSQEGEGDSR